MAEEIPTKYFFWTEKDIDKFPDLPSPVETWEMVEGETRKIRVLRWQLFRHLIHPEFYPPGVMKKTLALRIWVAPEYKPVGPPYWDIHQSHLVSALVPLLGMPDIEKYEFEITWVGKGPSARPEIKYKRIIP